MTRRLLFVLAALLLAACSGIPLLSLPRLMSLQSQVLDMDPVDFMLAVQVDARLAPPEGAVPYLLLKIAPAREGAFEIIDRRLPLQLTQGAAGVLNLDAAPSGRRWLFYSLPEESRADLQRVQARFRELRAQRSTTGGGSLSVGIEQTGLAVRDPVYANTRWETWLRTSRGDGFFEVWSGSVAGLLKGAKTAS